VSSRTLKHFSDALRIPADSPTLVRGIIAAVYGVPSSAQRDGYTCDVFVQGSLQVTQGVGVLASYSPAVGDVTWVLVTDDELIAIGTLTDAPASSGSSYPEVRVGYSVVLDTSLMITTLSGTTYPQQLAVSSVSCNIAPGRAYKVEVDFYMQWEYVGSPGGPSVWSLAIGDVSGGTNEGIDGEVQVDNVPYPTTFGGTAVVKGFWIYENPSDNPAGPAEFGLWVSNAGYTAEIHGYHYSILVTDIGPINSN
jgi:hypothetical protein